jgi:hypothetical protein
MGRREGMTHSALFMPTDEVLSMSQPNDLRKSVTALEQDKTSIAVIEMGPTSWLLAGIVPGVGRQPLKKLAADEKALLQVLQRWRNEAAKAGFAIERLVVAYEAGRDGFWLARWLRARKTFLCARLNKHKQTVRSGLTTRGGDHPPYAAISVEKCRIGPAKSRPRPANRKGTCKRADQGLDLGILGSIARNRFQIPVANV